MLIILVKLISRITFLVAFILSIILFFKPITYKQFKEFLNYLFTVKDVGTM